MFCQPQRKNCLQRSLCTAKFEDAMDDDLNTADAISAIFELVKFANTNANDASSGAFVTALKKEIVALSDVLGLQVEKKEENLDAEIENDRRTSGSKKSQRLQTCR